MATALNKFQESMNKVSLYWTKSLEVTAQNGEIIVIKCDGFCFKSDPSGPGCGNPGTGEELKQKEI